MTNVRQVTVTQQYLDSLHTEVQHLGKIICTSIQHTKETGDIDFCRGINKCIEVINKEIAYCDTMSNKWEISDFDKLWYTKRLLLLNKLKAVLECLSDD